MDLDLENGGGNDNDAVAVLRPPTGLTGWSDSPSHVAPRGALRRRHARRRRALRRQPRAGLSFLHGRCGSAKAQQRDDRMPLGPCARPHRDSGDGRHRGLHRVVRGRVRYWTATAGLRPIDD
jgi:hypothetical protein